MGTKFFVGATAIALLVVACAADVNPEATTVNEPQTERPAESDTQSPTSQNQSQIAETTMAPDPPTETTSTQTETPAISSTTVASEPSPPTLTEMAVADLASRLGVDPASITVVLSQDVTWRDGSLGCPEPGMSYTQALVDGFRVILSADDTEYAYHSGRDQPPFFCADPPAYEPTTNS